MKTIITAFLRQAEQHPGNIAVMDVRGAITYDRMNALSAYLAEEILRRLGGMDRRGRIALLLPRTKAFVVAQFAVLRAGCAVVPIDAEYPAVPCTSPPPPCRQRFRTFRCWFLRTSGRPTIPRIPRGTGRWTCLTRRRKDTSFILPAPPENPKASFTASRC